MATIRAVRVLVVEDEPPVRHVIDRILTGRGHHVISAASAYDAMALLLDFPEPPAVALLDLILPGMGGFAFAATLSRQYPAIRLVFMTGWVDRPEIAEAGARGSLLLKPFTPESLLAAVERDA